MASCDPLTLLPRRSSFLLALELAAAETIGTTLQMALLLVEVADDTLARAREPSGRSVSLRTVANLIRLVASRDGTVGCMSDGLFAVMLTTCRPMEGRATAELLDLALSLHFSDAPLRTTIAVATTPILQPWSAGELISLAEWRLSVARRGGRRCVDSGGFDPRQPNLASWPWD